MGKSSFFLKDWANIESYKKFKQKLNHHLSQFREKLIIEQLQTQK